MLLAQETIGQSPWLFALIIGVLSAIGSSALSLGVGWFILTRTEAYRRASRWEPRAEALWHERMKVYQELLTVSDLTAGTLAKKTGVLEGHIKQLVLTEVVAFQGACLKAMTVVSAGVFDALNNLIVLFNLRASTGISSVEEYQNELFPLLARLVNEMRTDLGPHRLDEMSRDLFPTRLPS
jgi:hypothetical protein